MYSVALYMRLSKDDKMTQSLSINNQRKLLYSYVRENNLEVYGEYVDDGFSGTTFDRPEFKRMLCDIESGNVNMVVTKDLSRLGREYIQTGQYTEFYFPSKKVRYVAINDNYDSLNRNDDTVPFKNVINEMYARDTSKKIHSSLNTLMKEGEFIGAFAPYGYKKDCIDKHKLVIDEKPAKIVLIIFNQYLNGLSPSKIAEKLNNDGVITPLMYRHEIRNTQIKYNKWTASTINKILANQIYTGDMVQGKTTKISFKNKKSVLNNKADWIVKKGTHESIVSKEDFEKVQKIKSERKCRGNRNKSHVNIFSDVVLCKDCGKPMAAIYSKRNKDNIKLECKLYKTKGKKYCLNHYIDYNDLCNEVQKLLKTEFAFTKKQKDTIVSKALKSIDKESDINRLYRQLKSVKERLATIKKIRLKIYTDYLENNIKQEMYLKSLEKYASEEKNLYELKTDIENKIKKLYSDNAICIAAEELNKLLEFENINKHIIDAFISKIEIGQGMVAENVEVFQQINVYLKFSE